jgi:hypothetical protein
MKGYVPSKPWYATLFSGWIQQKKPYRLIFHVYLESAAFSVFSGGFQHYRSKAGKVHAKKSGYNAGVDL